MISIVLLTSIVCVQAQELLLNPGFEDPLTSDDWFCNGGSCELTRDDSDAHEGQYSGLVTDR